MSLPRVPEEETARRQHRRARQAGLRRRAPRPARSVRASAGERPEDGRQPGRDLVEVAAPELGDRGDGPEVERGLVGVDLAEEVSDQPRPARGPSRARPARTSPPAGGAGSRARAPAGRGGRPGEDEEQRARIRPRSVTGYTLARPRCSPAARSRPGVSTTGSAASGGGRVGAIAAGRDHEEPAGARRQLREAGVVLAAPPADEGHGAPRIEEEARPVRSDRERACRTGARRRRRGRRAAPPAPRTAR